ncbi:RNA polymerase sigma factor [Polyangium fumosum]|uniref:RNA polymerase sigma factor n=1 Tax=Polyangium fumosum TaxID=889272 RepID=UPI001478E5BD|nr:sigma-70 family RNA polymerase sigma factor [Polyangium fumosum]
MRPWLWIIAVRTAARYHKRKQRPFVLLTRRLRSILRVPSDEPTPEEMACQTGCLELIALVRPQLPPRMQAVFSAAWDQGMSHEEIAEALGIPPERSRVYLHQAMQRLADAMKEARRKPKAPIILPIAWFERWFRRDGAPELPGAADRAPGARTLAGLRRLLPLVEPAGTVAAGLVLGGAAMAVWLEVIS